MILFRLSIAAGALLAVSPALAHPGPHDGHQPGGILHWVTQPDHVAVLAMAALALATGVGLWWRSRR